MLDSRLVCLAEFAMVHLTYDFLQRPANPHSPSKSLISLS